MRKTELSNRRVAEIKRKATDLERKKQAWKRYESNIRQAKSGYTELDVT